MSKPANWLISSAAAVCEFVDWWWTLLRTCARGNHEPEALTDGKRTLIICCRCMKQLYDSAEHGRVKESKTK